MAGSIEKRGSNSWRLTYSMGYDQNGKRIKKQKTIKAKNKTEANKKLAEFVTEIEAGQYIDPSKIKLADFVEEWREKYAKKHLSAKTLETYGYPLKNYILPTFGHARIGDVKPIHIINYLDSLEQDGIRKDNKPGGLSSSSIYYHYRVLRDIFSRAYDWKLIKSNPVESVKRPKVTQNKTEVYTDDEVREVFEKLQNEPISNRIMITLAITAGLRRGELLGLQWEDINFEDRTIQVNHSLQYTKEDGYKLKKPKNNKVRVVIPPNFVLEELRQFHHMKKKERLQAAELWEGGSYFFVFSTWHGKPYYPTVPGTWWRRFINRTGLKYIRFHDLRHTAATLLINQGVHAKVISERLGHADIKTTMNIYGHYVRQADEEAADKLNQLFRPSQQG
ncbi:tyrosine-type recombinase/integrase [Pseudalkalibacillus decolorationis]|uniref:tyrosine-type recombinase/integrase n=1 Tax=Pseudalkalibacillus decolorationis TaxID=163879 RepID=UPI002148636C|nr:site-specific integrase [Pseudalkalibacillus decolorationis]